MSVPINIYSTPQLRDYFYSRQVWSTISLISNFLSGHEIHLFPEATIKTNKIPNGLLIKSPRNKTTLMPSVLRDPGCGFLIFKLKEIDPGMVLELCKSILTFCNHLEMMPNMHKQELTDGVCYGVQHFITEKCKYANSCFPIDFNYLYQDIDFDLLCQDLKNITNTLELKAPLGFANTPQDLIGFIHTGSEYFPNLIFSEWVSVAADFSFSHSLSSASAIHNGIFGLPADLEEAYRYQQSIKAAMNFCLFKRHWIFKHLNEYLQQHYKIDVILLSDSCHAGLFEKTEDNTSYLFQARGVQLLAEHILPYMMAGQKESLSYLLTPNNFNTLAYLGHGTSYQVHSHIDYRGELGKKESEKCLKQLNNLVSNTRLDKDKCLAYTYNIKQQQEYLKNFDFTFTPLYPLLNYQGPYLRRVLPC